MENNIKTKEQVVRYETWINQDTGETREFAVIDKPYSSDFNFHKIWLNDLAKVLDILGGAKMKVFNYILQNINPYSNEFGGTIREISKECKVASSTVNETILKLVSADFMRKVRTGCYRVNPKMLVKGTHNKRVGLMLKYDELQEGRQLELIENSEEW